MNCHRPATQNEAARANGRAMPLLFMKAMSALVALTLCALTCTAYADIHQWRDAQGRVQFGDKPPTGADADVTTITLPKTSTPRTDDDAHDPRRVYERTNRLFDAQDKKKLEEERKQAAENAASPHACTEARDRERIMTGRVAFTDKDGNEIQKTETERMAMLAEIQAWIAKNCR